MKFTLSTVPVKGSVSWKPRSYQQRGMKWLAQHLYAMLLFDPGLGKTSVTLGAVAAFKKHNIPHKTLIVAPLKVAHNTWPAEMEKWAQFKDLTFRVLHGPKKDQYAKDDVDVYIINPEGLKWLSGKVFKSLKVSILVLDESTKFKHKGTDKYRYLETMLPHFARRWALTGTPMPNGLEDLFGQVYALDLGARLGRYITKFRMQYFAAKQVGVVSGGPRAGQAVLKYTPNEGAEEEVFDKLKDLALRMQDSDYLELPELVENDILLDLPAGARKIYDELERVGLVELLDGSMASSSASANSMRLRQFCGGATYLTQPEDEPLKRDKEYEVFHTEKLDALESVVEELQGAPLLVGYEFQHELWRLLERFGEDTPYLGRGVAPAKVTSIIKEWNAGNIPILFGQMASMAHGLNMQNACGHIYIYTQTWDLEVAAQFIKRVHRSGNTHQRVVVHRPMMRGTVDTVVAQALRSKDKDQAKLLNYLRAYARQRGFK